MGENAMTKKLLLLFGGLALLAGGAGFAAAKPEAKDAKAVLADLAKAMGAANVKTIQYSATGSYFWLGQGYRAVDPWPKFTLRNYMKTVDYDNGAYEEKLAWTEAPADFTAQQRGGGLTPLKGEGMGQDNCLGGDYAWNQGGNGNAAPQSAAVATERQLRLAITPDGFIKTAMAANPTVASKKVNGKTETVISFAWKDKFKVNGYVNGQNILDRVETWIPQPILGDMPVEISYSDYRDFSGVKFPAHIVQKEGGYPVLDLMVNAVTPNVPVNITVPPAAKNAPAPLRVVTTPMGNGVWVMRAGTQSLAVEFKDFVAIIDGAGNEERSIGVIAETKKAIPNKPIQYVINTHHHLDHSGGLRTFVAEGVTIVTGEENKPYFERIFKLPHNLDPDELAKSPKAPKFVTVKDKYVLTDGDQSIELYRLRDDKYPDHQNSHAPDLLISYLPKSKILAEPDFYNPAPPPAPNARVTTVNLIGNKENLLENIKRLNLDVAQFVPMHYGNNAVPFSQLLQEIQIEHAQLDQFEKQTRSSALQ
jgi:hypothetical protein